MISAGVLLIAVVSAIIYLHIRQRRQSRRRKKKQKHQRKKRQRAVYAGAQLRQAVNRFGGTTHVAVMLLAAVAIFVMVGVVFYSSFFTNSKGVVAAFETSKSGAERERKITIRSGTSICLDDGGGIAVVDAGSGGDSAGNLARDESLHRLVALWAFGIVAASR